MVLNVFTAGLLTEKAGPVVISKQGGHHQTHVDVTADELSSVDKRLADLFTGNGAKARTFVIPAADLDSFKEDLVYLAWQP